MRFTFGCLILCHVKSTINLWNSATAELMGTLVGHSNAVTNMAVHRDLLVSCSLSEVLLWNWRLKAFVRKLGDHTGKVYRHAPILATVAGLVDPPSSFVLCPIP
jgi:WD40 repeat protein